MFYTVLYEDMQLQSRHGVLTNHKLVVPVVVDDADTPCSPSQRLRGHTI